MATDLRVDAVALIQALHDVTAGGQAAEGVHQGGRYEGVHIRGLADVVAHGEPLGRRLVVEAHRKHACGAAKLLKRRRRRQAVRERSFLLGARGLHASGALPHFLQQAAFVPSEIAVFLFKLFEFGTWRLLPGASGLRCQAAHTTDARGCTRRNSSCTLSHRPRQWHVLLGEATPAEPGPEPGPKPYAKP